MTTRAEQVSVSTVNRELDLLRSMLREAVPKYLLASPLLKLRRVRPKTNLDAMPDRDAAFIVAHRRSAADPNQRRTIIKNVLSRTCRRTGSPFGRKSGGITFHSFRHTGATRMLEASVDLRTVQEIRGWSDIRLLQRYLHPSADRLRAALETIGGPGTGRE